MNGELRSAHRAAGVAPDAHPAGLAPRRACALFSSAIGECGLAWEGHALTHVLLPAATAAQTMVLLRRLCGAAGAAPAPWPAFVNDAVAALQALLRGEPAELDRIPIDLARVGDFERRVYEAARRVGPGRTCTYGELAQAIGEPGAARAVGAALGRNPWPLVVPCHRVLAAGGRIGGFSAPGGAAAKQRLLAIEAGMHRREGELF